MLLKLSLNTETRAAALDPYVARKAAKLHEVMPLARIKERYDSASWKGDGAAADAQAPLGPSPKARNRGSRPAF